MTACWRWLLKTWWHLSTSWESFLILCQFTFILYGIPLNIKQLNHTVNSVHLHVYFILILFTLVDIWYSLFMLIFYCLFGFEIKMVLRGFGVVFLLSNSDRLCPCYWYAVNDTCLVTSLLTSVFIAEHLINDSIIIIAHTSIIISHII